MYCWKEVEFVLLVNLFTRILFIYLSIYLSIYLTIYLAIYLYIHAYTHIHIYRYIERDIYTYTNILKTCENDKVKKVKSEKTYNIQI